MKSLQKNMLLCVLCASVVRVGVCGESVCLGALRKKTTVHMCTQYALLIYRILKYIIIYMCRCEVCSRGRETEGTGGKEKSSYICRHTKFKLQITMQKILQTQTQNLRHTHTE